MTTSISARSHKRLLLWAVTLACLFTLQPAFGHHGTAVSYDQERLITVTGTVTEFLWRNPHSSLYLDVNIGDGQIVNYAIELASPMLMTRSSGWTNETFAVGDVVQFRVHPSRTGAPVGECLFDCQVLINGEPPVSRAEDQQENAVN